MDYSPNNSTGGPPEAPAAPLRKVYRSVSSTAEDADPLTTTTDECQIVLLKPFLRGKIHLLLLMLAPFWVYLLFSVCWSFQSFVAAAISCFSFGLNFFASAILHCVDWSLYSPSVRELFSKLDHAGIFVVISGSTTPIPFLLLDAATSLGLLLVQTLATGYGFWVIMYGDLSSGARKQRAYTFIFVGLLHALFLGEYVRVLTPAEFSYVILMACSYVLGGLVYGYKWPDPLPQVYGFHELFHTFCLISFALTIYLDFSVILRSESQKLAAEVIG